MKEYYIAVFKSKNHAMQMFYTLESKGYYFFDLIATPSRISVGCSYSIKFNILSDFNHLKTINGNLTNIISGIYSVRKIDGKKYYEKLNVSI